MKKFLRILLIAIAILTAAVVVRFAMLGHGSKSGEAAGLISGTLSSCPDKPNCVCSEFDEDTAHYVAPLDYSGAPQEKAWSQISQIIEDLDGEIVVSSDEYIAATFSSALFGFVDDVECRLEPSQKRIQIRSASRVGYSDMDVNRNRVETMTRLFTQKMGGSGDAAE